MDDDRLKGAATNLGGKVKDAVGVGYVLAYLIHRH